MGGLSHTVSGDIASFRTPSRVPIESLKFHFLPKQEGSGDPSPTNVRPITGWTGVNGYESGYNVLPFESVIQEGYTTELDGVTATYSNGIIHFSGNHTKSGWSNVILFYSVWSSNPIVLPPGTYTVSNGLAVVCKIDDETYANQVGTFTVKNRALVQGFYAAILGEGPVDKYLPLVLTVGTKRPKKYIPYKPININSFTFPQKNLFDKDGLIEYGYISSNGEAVYTELGKYTVYYIPVQPSTNYILSGTSNNGVLTAVSAYTDTKQFISRLGSEYSTHLNSNPIAFTTPSNCYYIRINLPIEYSFYQLEVGNSVTDYEPYCGAQYGGYYDPVAGEIVAEYALATAIKSDFGDKLTPSSGGMEYRNTTKTYLPTASGVNWNTASQQQKFNLGLIANPYSEVSYGNYIGVMLTMSNYNMTMMRISESLYQAMGDDDVAMISYKLETPIHIPVPAEDMKAFLDHNNFWSDTNDITEVTYAVTESKDILATRKKAMEFDIGHRKKVRWNQLS